jgi:hypothetical protein
MIHADKDCEVLERVQLDDYDNYPLDPLDEDVDASMGIEFLVNIKIEDAYDIQKERRKLINAKHANAGTTRSRRTSRGAATSTTPPRTTFMPSSTLAGTLAMLSLSGSKSAKKWKPTAPPTIKSLSTTWRQLGSVSKKLGNNPPLERRLSFRRNDSRKPSMGDASGTRRTSIPCLNVKLSEGPWELRHSTKTTKKGDGIYPNNYFFHKLSIRFKEVF